MSSELLQYQDKEFAHMAQIVNNLSNEWRQPISYLSSQILYLETLQRFANEQQFSLEVDKILPSINNAIEKMHETMEVFSRFYDQPHSAALLDPYQEVKNLSLMFEQQLILHNIDLTINCEKDMRLQLCKRSFSNILLILFENAIESFQKKKVAAPFIQIDIQKKGEYVTLVVKSNANTLSKDDQKILFKRPFSTKSRSSGLGLIIAKTIVEERLNGTIDFYCDKEQIEFIVECNLKTS